MDFHKGVVGVSLARQQGLDLAGLGFRLEALQDLHALLLGGFIALRLAQFHESGGVIKLALKTAQGAKALLKLRALAHDLLRGFGVIPKIGVFDLGVQFGKTSR